MYTGCGGEIKSPGLIKSPINYEEDESDTTNVYPSDADCTWIIRAPPDQVVLLKYV